MLDDHDITDGWGGRLESFDVNNVFYSEWSRYFDLTYDAFVAYQACKNPEPLCDEAQTTYVDFGDNRIFLMDFRKQKNAAQKVLISPTHLAHIQSAIRQTDKRIFILSPVVPVRIDPEDEDLIAFVTEKSYRLNKWLRKFQDARISTGLPGWLNLLIAGSVWATGKIGELADDAKDSLSCGVNRACFLRLLATLQETYDAHGRQIAFLSGDIHTGGISEITIEQGGLVIPQIVSSPIGYEPMGKTTKDNTTTEEDCKIGDENIQISFRNIFYRTARNFAIINPERLAAADGIEFHFENLSKPMICPAYYQPQADRKILERINISNQNISQGAKVS